MTAQGAAVLYDTNTHIRVYSLLAPTDTNAAVVEVTVDEAFTGMGVSVVSFTGGDPAGVIRGSITTSTGAGSTSMTVTQASQAGDIVLCFGATDDSAATVTYSAGTKIGTDVATFAQFKQTTASKAGEASAVITASVDFSNWAMWAMSVK